MMNMLPTYYKSCGFMRISCVHNGKTIEMSPNSIFSRSGWPWSSIDTKILESMTTSDFKFLLSELYEVLDETGS